MPRTKQASKPKASKDSLAGMGRRRDVIGNGVRCVGVDCAGAEWPSATDGTCSRDHLRPMNFLRRAAETRRRTGGQRGVAEPSGRL